MIDYKELRGDIYYELVYDSDNYGLIKKENISFDSVEYIINEKKKGKIKSGRVNCLTIKTKKEGINKIKKLEDRNKRANTINRRKVS